MKLIQIKINLQGEVATRDIYVQDKSISKLAGTHRIKLPAVHDNIINRKYVEKKDLNKNFANNGYDIVMLCEPEKLEECMNLAKEERKKLLETVLIPQAKASLYAYELELDKINKAEVPASKEEISEDAITEAPKVEAAPEPTPVVPAKTKRDKKPRARKAKEEVKAPVEATDEIAETAEIKAEEQPKAEAPAPKRRARAEKKVDAEVPTPKMYEEMTLAELKQECAKLGIVPASRNKEKIIAQLRGA